MLKTMRYLAVGLVAAVFSAGAAAQDIWTGGVGEGERDNAPQRNTRIQFFTQGGPYLADVHYVLYDERGNNLHEGTADGPWLLLNLDAGTYSVKATRNETGETQSTRFFKEGGNRLVLGLEFGRGSAD